jgi:KaiC/GvpD/RAD55 family RecA-like ATPase
MCIRASLCAATHWISMKSKNFRASMSKQFDDLMPKLDNGNIDWETVKKRVSQNMDATEMLLGKIPPQALEIEAAILGACLIDPTAFPKATSVLSGFLNPFYTDTHNAIWGAMERLCEKKEPMDRLPVYQELEAMQKTQLIQGNPYFLTQLTELVTSSAHIESHSRILLDKYLRRRLMHLGIQIYQQASNPSNDLFEVIEEQKFQIGKLTDFNPTLKGENFPEVMEKAKKATPKTFLIGRFIKIGDVAILFSGPENGKSIFGIQMADKISKGESLFNGLLRNECEPQKVLYFDFELSLSDYKNRYLDGAGNEYPFRKDGWMVRVGNNEENPKTFADIATNMERILTQNIEQFHPNVVFIDNITAMSNGSTADAEVIRKIMNLLRELKNKYHLTVVVLAHTPKRYDLSKPLAIEDLAGSFLLAAYADTIIAIGRSKMGNNVKYLIHLKVRDGVKIHDELNVINVSIEKEGAFLHMKTLEEPTGRETDHLMTKNEIAISDETIKQMVMLHDEGKSNQVIKDEMKIPLSRQHIGRLIKTHKAKMEAEVKAFEAVLIEQSSSE